MLSSKTLYQAETYPPLVKNDCNDSTYIKASVEHKCRITDWISEKWGLCSFIHRSNQRTIRRHRLQTSWSTAILPDIQSWRATPILTRSPSLRRDRRIQLGNKTFTSETASKSRFTTWRPHFKHVHRVAVLHGNLFLTNKLKSIIMTWVKTVTFQVIFMRRKVKIMTHHVTCMRWSVKKDIYEVKS